MNQSYIRHATLIDLPQIRLVEKYSFYPYLYRSQRYFKKLIKTSRLAVFIVDDTVVAYIGFSLRKKICLISDLAVFLCNRNKGYASNLLNFVFEKCYIKNIKKVRLVVDIKNEKAISLYYKYNFKLKKTLKNYYGTSDGLLLIKEI